MNISPATPLPTAYSTVNTYLVHTRGLLNNPRFTRSEQIENLAQLSDKDVKDLIKSHMQQSFIETVAFEVQVNQERGEQQLPPFDLCNIREVVESLEVNERNAFLSELFKYTKENKLPLNERWLFLADENTFKTLLLKVPEQVAPLKELAIIAEWENIPIKAKSKLLFFPNKLRWIIFSADGDENLIKTGLKKLSRAEATLLFYMIEQITEADQNDHSALATYLLDQFKEGERGALTYALSAANAKIRDSYLTKLIHDMISTDQPFDSIFRELATSVVPDHFTNVFLEIATKENRFIWIQKMTAAIGKEEGNLKGLVYLLFRLPADECKVIIEAPEFVKKFASTTFFEGLYEARLHVTRNWDGRKASEESFYEFVKMFPKELQEPASKYFNEKGYKRLL